MSTVCHDPTSTEEFLSWQLEPTPQRVPLAGLIAFSPVRSQWNYLT